MHELCPSPLSTCSSGECKQMCNDVTATAAKAEATAQAPFIHKSASQVTSRGRSKVTDMGVARAVNQHDLDRFHAEYGFKLSPQLDDAQCYQILEMYIAINLYLHAI